MKRFLHILGLLTVVLLLLASGVNATLDRLDRASSENGFVCYNDKGEVVFALAGAPALAQKIPRPVHATTGALFRPADTSVASTADAAADQTRYF
jgi:hypothetical protein